MSSTCSSTTTLTLRSASSGATTSDGRRGSVRFSPRPRNHPSVRRLSFIGSLDYTLNTAGLLESRDQTLRFETEFHSSDSLTVSGTRSYDLLPRPFTIAPGVTVPVGGYTK